MPSLPELAPGWIEARDPATGQYYWFNLGLNKSTWDRSDAEIKPPSEQLRQQQHQPVQQLQPAQVQSNQQVLQSVEEVIEEHISLPLRYPTSSSTNLQLSTTRNTQEVPTSSTHTQPPAPVEVEEHVLTLSPELPRSILAAAPAPIASVTEETTLSLPKSISPTSSSSNVTAPISPTTSSPDIHSVPRIIQRTLSSHTRFTAQPKKEVPSITSTVEIPLVIQHTASSTTLAEPAKPVGSDNTSPGSLKLLQKYNDMYESNEYV